MTVPEELRYTKEHEWVRLEGEEATVGITHFAQEELGDVVYVELPKVGDRVEFMKPFGVVESVKAASDLFSPLSGEVTAVNEQLAERPELINQDPYGQGWMLRVRVAEGDEPQKLLSAQEYREHTAQD